MKTNQNFLLLEDEEDLWYFKSYIDNFSSIHFYTFLVIEEECIQVGWKEIN